MEKLLRLTYLVPILKYSKYHFEAEEFLDKLCAPTSEYIEYIPNLGLNPLIPFSTNH